MALLPSTAGLNAGAHRGVLSATLCVSLQKSVWAQASLSLTLDPNLAIHADFGMLSTAQCAAGLRQKTVVSRRPRQLAKQIRTDHGRGRGGGS